MDLYIKVLTALKKRKMTFKDLAKILGISGAYLSDILNGKRDGKKAMEHVETIKSILKIKE